MGRMKKTGTEAAANLIRRALAIIVKKHFTNKTMVSDDVWGT